MSGLVILSKEGCPFCSLLKMELTKRGYRYREVDLTNDDLRQRYYSAAKVNTVPQLYRTEHDNEFSPLSPTGHRLGGWSEVSGNWTVLEPR